MELGGGRRPLKSRKRGKKGKGSARSDDNIGNRQTSKISKYPSLYEGGVKNRYEEGDACNISGERENQDRQAGESTGSKEKFPNITTTHKTYDRRGIQV